jgi:hypothetical protein
MAACRLPSATNFTAGEVPPGGSMMSVGIIEFIMNGQYVYAQPELGKARWLHYAISVSISPNVPSRRR